MQTIRALREAKGWTQAELAHAVEVAPSTIYNWESGRVEPTVSKLRAVAGVFGVRMDDIALVIQSDEDAKKAAPVAA